LIPKFVERQNIKEVNDDEEIQISSVFEIDGKSLAILTDIEKRQTILSDAPLNLGEEIDVLFKSESRPGTQVNLNVGSKVEGYGVFTFPYGPVTYGVPEAGGFKLVTYGERIVKVIPQINFKKRGVEGRVAGMQADDALLLIERSAGNFSAAYSTCFVTAIENILGLEVPSRTRWIRATALELERIYNHLYVFARQAEAASQNVATAEANILRERVLRINAKYFGHRFLFGLNRLGGVNYGFTAKEEQKALSNKVKEVTAQFTDLVDYFLSSRIFLDRLQNTAKLARKDALKLSSVGPVARGSNIEWDDRLTFPMEPYDDIFSNIETESDGDSMARTVVRINEILSSMVILEQLLDEMPPDNILSNIGKKEYTTNSLRPKEIDYSFCRIESPSGDLIHVVQLDEENRIKFLHIRPASLVNWLSFAKSLEGSVFTDFQFAFESFGLSFADSDR
jgi:Ni,Fe-hydrogenase III large subunit